MSDNHGNFESIPHTDGIAVDVDLLESSAARKQAERDELSRQVEEFLASGGQIDEVAANVLADPPKKPTSNYGSQPI
ncbi:MAG: hypothetical protein ACRBCI_03310 [Cellvibrionaceae bacterium]